MLCCVSLFAQERQHKLKEKFDVNKDVTVNLNTSHTNVVFETWNRNTIEVEAFLEGDDLTDENSQRILDSWKVNVSGNGNDVLINSVAGNLWTRSVTATNVRVTKEELRMLEPAIASMLGPIMENIANNPMPNALSDDFSNVSINARKNNPGEAKYIKQWENQIREKFSDDKDQKKQLWAKQFEENPKISVQKEIRLETWGQQYGKQMEAWASQLIKDIENQQRRTANVTVYRYSSKKKNVDGGVNKIIKVRIPVGAKLKLNIRHGDVQLAERSKNIRASLSHTKLSANVIDGNQTFIKASYSPVFVRQWNNGRLVVNYVKNCRIQNAKNLLVNADSSNIYIQQLDENGAISGSFGIITIENLGESFSTLDLAVQNSDFKLTLPQTAFNISYSGVQSLISIPRSLETNTRKNFGNVFINGFQKTRSTDKMITINAKYSEVVLNNK
ncbi:hypothetical protein GCM10022259_24930 [Aquimarina mytili]